MRALNSGGVPMGKALTPNQCQKVRTFLRAINTAYTYQNGLNVGEFLNMYRDAISGVSDNRGRWFRSNKKWTKERIELGRNLRKSGMTWKEVGERLGVTGAAAQQSCKRW